VPKDFQERSILKRVINSLIKYTEISNNCKLRSEDLYLNQIGNRLYESISEQELERANLMLLNYPSNPTAATLNIDTFMKAITLFCKNDMVLANNAAYDLVTFGLVNQISKCITSTECQRLRS